MTYPRRLASHALVEAQRELETLRTELRGERQLREESILRKSNEDSGPGLEEQTALLDKLAKLQEEVETERRRRVLAEEAVEQRAAGSGNANEAQGSVLDGQFKVDHDIQRKELASKREEMEGLRSSLEAARAENSTLLSRIGDLSAAAGQDGKASGAGFNGADADGGQAGGGSPSDGDDSTGSLRLEFEKERAQWDKERTDMQEQIRKLLQACVEEEHESDLARKREAAAREQLARFNAIIPQESGGKGMYANGSQLGHDAPASTATSASASKAPQTPGTPSLARNDPMYLGFGEGIEGADWQVTKSDQSPLFPLEGRPCI